MFFYDTGPPYPPRPPIAEVERMFAPAAAAPRRHSWPAPIAAVERRWDGELTYTRHEFAQEYGNAAESKWDAARVIAPEPPPAAFAARGWPAPLAMLPPGRFWSEQHTPLPELPLQSPDVAGGLQLNEEWAARFAATAERRRLREEARAAEPQVWANAPPRPQQQGHAPRSAVRSTPRAAVRAPSAAERAAAVKKVAARRAVAYGAAADSVKRAEASLNAAFDAEVDAHGSALWPEMPLADG